MHEIKPIVASYKQDTASPDNKVLAKKLESIIKTANAYTKSKNKCELGFAGSLAAPLGLFYLYEGSHGFSLLRPTPWAEHIFVPP